MEKKNQNNSCSICGKCCTYEIPLTLRDINNIALALEVSPKNIMSKYLQSNLSIITGLYLLRKNELSNCVLIDKKNYCTIHSHKPEICREYLCLKVMLKNMAENLKEDYVLPDRKTSGILTIEYIKRNGFQYNKIDFEKTLEEINNG